MDPQALADVPLFEGMSDEQLADCAARFNEVWVRMGEKLTHEEDFGYSLFVVLNGQVRVDVGGEKVAELGPGDHFGEVALVRGTRRNATVKATEATRLAKLMTWDFREVLAENPELAARLEESARRREGN